jgi:hypothetical protein
MLDGDQNESLSDDSIELNTVKHRINALLEIDGKRIEFKMDYDPDAQKMAALAKEAIIHILQTTPDAKEVKIYPLIQCYALTAQLDNTID